MIGADAGGQRELQVRRLRDPLGGQVRGPEGLGDDHLGVRAARARRPSPGRPCRRSRRARGRAPRGTRAARALPRRSRRARPAGSRALSASARSARRSSSRCAECRRARRRADSHRRDRHRERRAPSPSPAPSLGDPAARRGLAWTIIPRHESDPDRQRGRPRQGAVAGGAARPRGLAHDDARRGGADRGPRRRRLLPRAAADPGRVPDETAAALRARQRGRRRRHQRARGGGGEGRRPRGRLLRARRLGRDGGRTGVLRLPASGARLRPGSLARPQLPHRLLLPEAARPAHRGRERARARRGGRGRHRVDPGRRTRSARPRSQPSRPRRRRRSPKRPAPTTW